MNLSNLVHRTIGNDNQVPCLFNSPSTIDERRQNSMIDPNHRLGHADIHDKNASNMSVVNMPLEPAISHGPSTPHSPSIDSLDQHSFPSSPQQQHHHSPPSSPDPPTYLVHPSFKQEADVLNLKIRQPTSRPIITGKTVTSETLEDGYIQFVLRHDPDYIGDGIESLMYVKRKFSSVPKTGHLSYTTWDVYMLVRKLHHQEIKNWSQLVGKLGLADMAGRPQFAQRVKRWMHKYKIDCYFDYLLGNPFDFDAVHEQYSGCLMLGNYQKRKPDVRHQTHGTTSGDESSPGYAHFRSISNSKSNNSNSNSYSYSYSNSNSNSHTSKKRRLGLNEDDHSSILTDEEHLDNEANYKTELYGYSESDDLDVDHDRNNHHNTLGSQDDEVIGSQDSHTEEDWSDEERGIPNTFYNVSPYDTIRDDGYDDEEKEEGEHQKRKRKQKQQQDFDIGENDDDEDDEEEEEEDDGEDEDEDEDEGEDDVNGDEDEEEEDELISSSSSPSPTLSYHNIPYISAAGPSESSSTFCNNCETVNKKVVSIEDAMSELKGHILLLETKLEQQSQANEIKWQKMMQLVRDREKRCERYERWRKKLLQDLLRGPTDQKKPNDSVE
ncbi:ARS binding protein 2-domain-containing protein [Phycomyces blakesleeanus]|uniref:ARS binding protein 2-domain-containing protein n=1 Tax=Phycomyces blakesleeanus TaxID=4837 RepID=A0ABR3B3R6_PHYBL